MLKGLPKIFTPDLLRILMEMGHGEELLICDGNFPHKTNPCSDVVYITGCEVSELLESILQYFPLDTAVESAAVVMEGALGNGIRDKYLDIIRKSGSESQIECSERFDFYKRAAQVAGIIVTTDTTRCANIIIKKGCCD